MTEPGSPSLDAARDAVDLAQQIVDAACAAVRAGGGVDANQVVAYDVAHAAAAVATARAALDYGALGEIEGRLATAFVADVLADLIGRVAGREAAWGTQRDWIAPAAEFLHAGRDPAHVGCARQRRGAAASRE